MNANVIAIDVIGCVLIRGWIQIESDPIFEFVLKTLCRPTMLQEKKFKTGAFAVLAQVVAIFENLRDAFEHRQRLMLLHKRVQAQSKVRIRRQTAADSQRKTCFGSST